MRPTITLVLLLSSCPFLGLAVWAQETPAQLPPTPQEYVAPTAEVLAAITGPARLAVYFDRTRHSRSRAVEPGQLFEFHLVAVGSVGGLRAWEAQLLIDERIQVITREMEGMNMGSGGEVYQVGLGNRCLADQELLLISYTARLATEASDLVIGIAPLPEGSFDPPAPGYLSCDAKGLLLPFEIPAQAAVLNPDKIQIPDDDLGEKKPEFRMESGREGGE